MVSDELKSLFSCSNLIGGDDVYSCYAVSTRISHMWGQSFIQNAFFGSLSQSFLELTCLVYHEQQISFFFLISFRRTTVKAAFLPVPRKYHDTPAIRLNSTDCSNEVEDDMLPWLPEDFTEDSTVVTIQWSIGRKVSLFISLSYSFLSLLLFGLNTKCRIRPSLSPPILSLSLEKQQNTHFLVFINIYFFFLWDVSFSLFYFKLIYFKHVRWFVRSFVSSFIFALSLVRSHL